MAIKTDLPPTREYWDVLDEVELRQFWLAVELARYANNASNARELPALIELRNKLPSLEERIASLNMFYTDVPEAQEDLSDIRGTFRNIFDNTHKIAEYVMPLFNNQPEDPEEYYKQA